MSKVINSMESPTIPYNISNNNTKEDNKVYSVFYSDEIENSHATIRINRCLVKEHKFVTGHFGSGKSYFLKGELIDEAMKGRFNITFVPTHILGDEYVAEYEKHSTEDNELPIIKLIGFDNGCDICKKNDGGNSKEFEKLTKLRDANVPKYIICQEMFKNGYCNFETCEYKQQWKLLRDRFGGIKSSAIAPASMIGAIDIGEFSGMTIVDENCAKFDADVEDFNPEKFEHMLNRIPMLKPNSKFTKKDIKKYISAIKNLDIAVIKGYEHTLVEIIMDYNEYVCEVYGKKSLDFRIKMYNTMNIVNIRMVCEFTKHERMLKEYKLPLLFENKVEKTINDIIECNDLIKQLNKAILQYKEALDDEDIDEDDIEDYQDGLELNEIQIAELKDVIYMNMYNLEFFINDNEIDISHLVLYEIGKFKFNRDDVDATIELMKSMQNNYTHQQFVSNEYRVEYGFNDVLMWQHYNAYNGKEIHYADGTFEQNQQYWLKELMDFKELFTEYAVKCSVYKMPEPTIRPNLVFSKTAKKLPKAKIAKSFYEDRKHLKDFIGNLKRRNNVNPMFCTHRDNLQKGKKVVDSILGVDAIYFKMGDGVNAYEDNDVLINYGTYLPPLQWYVDQVKEKCPEEYENINFNTFKYIDDKEARTTLPDNEILRKLFLDIWQMEVYNTIGRVRPFNKMSTIVWYGWNCPQQLIDMCNVVDKVHKNDKKPKVKAKGVTNIALEI